jgi:hypothetical protein
LPNGNLLYLAWEPVPKSLQGKVRGGIKGAEFPDGTMFNDYVVEIDANGRRVWEWHANDHLDPDIDIIGPFYRRQEWNHANSLSALKNGDILLTCRSTDSIMVVQKSSGKIILRWGNSTYLDKATGRLEYHAGSEYLGGPHDAREIPEGYPGAGHITCYNNRMNNGDFLRSEVVEVDRNTRQVKWKTPGKSLGRKHFSDFLGGAVRLPNGNTLVCDGANGRFFQITAAGKIIWEYVNPFIPVTHFQGAVLRVEAYNPDYCPQLKSIAEGGGTEAASAANAAPAGTPGSPAQNGAPYPRTAVWALLGIAAALVVFLFWSRTRSR